MPKSKGILRPEEKQNLQLKKNELIKDSLFLINTFNLSDSEIESIRNILVQITYHKVGAYRMRMQELNQFEFVLRGINSVHQPKMVQPAVQQFNNLDMFDGFFQSITK